MAVLDTIFLPKIYIETEHILFSIKFTVLNMRVIYLASYVKADKNNKISKLGIYQIFYQLYNY